MMICTRFALVVMMLLYSTASSAHNRVVVVPLGDGSSHQHPDMDYISFSAAAFEPILSTSFYNKNNGLLSTNAGPDDHISFSANLALPHGVTVVTASACLLYTSPSPRD